MPGRLREKDGRLARGVAPTDDHDLLAHAQLRLHARGGVVHARPFELRHVCERRLAVLGSRRDDQCARVDAPAIFQVHGVRGWAHASFAAPFATMTCAPNFCGLRVRASRELQA